MKQWRAHTEGDEPYHVWPLDDDVQHDTDNDDGDCVCGPAIEPVERDDGSIGWLITHHSLDGRERHESA